MFTVYPCEYFVFSVFFIPSGLFLSLLMYSETGIIDIYKRECLYIYS